MRQLLSENIISLAGHLSVFKREPVCVEHWRFLLLNYRGREKNAIHTSWEHIENRAARRAGDLALNARATAFVDDEGLVSRDSG